MNAINWEEVKANALAWAKVNTVPLVVGFVIGAVVL